MSPEEKLRRIKTQEFMNGVLKEQFEKSIKNKPRVIGFRNQKCPCGSGKRFKKCCRR